MDNFEVRKLLDARFGQHAGSRSAIECLLEYARRGAEDPEYMMLEEIQQVSLALLLLLRDIEKPKSS